MKTYDQHDMEQKKIYYFNVIFPLLIKSGYNAQKIISWFESGCVRLRWGKDWNNFTVHLTNPLNEPTCLIDNLIHSIWKGASVANTAVMSCFISMNKVSSVAVTDLYTLSEGFRRYGIKNRIRNNVNGQEFLTLPFSHPSLSKNVWGIGIR